MSHPAPAFPSNAPTSLSRRPTPSLFEACPRLAPLTPAEAERNFAIIERMIGAARADLVAAQVGR